MMGLNWPTLLAIAWVGLWLVSAVCIIAAAMMRCPKCRRWHDSPEEKCSEDLSDSSKPK